MVVVAFPVLMYALIRLHRQYRREAEVLGEGAAERAVEAKPLRRHVAFVLVDALDLATARAVQYARAMSVDDVRAIHFVIDAERARHLQKRWIHLGMRHLPLELVECQDRRLVRACLELAVEASAGGDTEVTVLLPRRAYSRVWNRFLHDQTADRIGAALSRLPHVNATIVPFDVSAALEAADQIAGVLRPEDMLEGELAATEKEEDEAAFARTVGTTAIASLGRRGPARVAGRIHSMTVQPWGSAPTLECEVTDDTGRITVAFLGRRQIAGVEPGSRVVLEGTVSERRGRLTMINPTYELLPSGDPAGAGSGSS